MVSDKIAIKVTGCVYVYINNEINYLYRLIIVTNLRSIITFIQNDQIDIAEIYTDFHYHGNVQITYLYHFFFFN